jgi:endonuclease/exonuclease/phosphatase family metal-dependent hydrolase
VLADWVQRIRREDEFVILGDFNRRLDVGPDELLDGITGRGVPGSRRIGLTRFPRAKPSLCYQELATRPGFDNSYHYVPIDHFLVSGDNRSGQFAEHPVAVPPGQERQTLNVFGDHCPKSLTLTMGN